MVIRLRHLRRIQPTPTSTNGNGFRLTSTAGLSYAWRQAELPAFISDVFDQTSDISIYMEAVHRLSDLGVVVTHTARAISNEDFDAEWRMITIFTIDDNAVTRTETFDEADLDTALARFDELGRRAPLLEHPHRPGSGQE